MAGRTDFSRFGDFGGDGLLELADSPRNNGCPGWNTARNQLWADGAKDRSKEENWRLAKW